MDTKKMQDETTNLENKSPGDILAQKRKSRGMTVRDISQALHLLPIYIEALEEGNYKKIPSTAFVKGYMRSYATFLGLDADDLIARLPSEYQLERVFSKNKDTNLIASKVKVQKISFFLISLIFVVGLVGLTLYWWQLRGEDAQNTTGAYDIKIEDNQEGANVLSPVEDPSKKDVQEISENSGEEQNSEQANIELDSNPSKDDSSLENQEDQTNQAPAVNSQSQAPVTNLQNQAEVKSKPKPAPSAKTLAKLANPGNLDLKALSALNNGTFILTFVDECWLQARDANGVELISTTANAGDLIKVEGKKPIRLILGKGRSARAHYKGQVFDLNPYTGETVARLTIR